MKKKKDDMYATQPVSADSYTDEKYLIETFRNSNLADKKKLVKYCELMQICDEINRYNQEKKLERNVTVIQDIDGNNIVVINDIIFKGKRNIEWLDVEKYLKRYVGEFYQIAETGDVVYIGTDLPDEYIGSKYTKYLKGTVAKAKANAAQVLPEMIEIATSKVGEENRKSKHNRHASSGKMYLYDVLEIKKETSKSCQE